MGSKSKLQDHPIDPATNYQLYPSSEGQAEWGVHLCAAWANAGYEVTMCSRSKEKAQEIVDTLVTRGM